jgi:hypothetical protein
MSFIGATERLTDWHSSIVQHCKIRYLLRLLKHCSVVCKGYLNTSRESAESQLLISNYLPTFKSLKASRRQSLYEPDKTTAQGDTGCLVQ